MQYVVIKYVEPSPPIIETPVLTAIGPFDTEAEAVAYRAKHGGLTVVQLVAPQP